MMSDRLLLNLAGIQARGIPFSRQHIHRLIRQGRFPKPVKLGYSTNAWLVSDIDRWIEERVAEREATATQVA